MGARVAVIVFPGSNCEFDAARAIEICGGEPTLVWHTEGSLDGFDAVILPGGFAHGDYLRPGAIARFSPVVAPLIDAAAAGVPVLGICNGFQVLTEAGLLPGALQKNAGLTFLSQEVTVLVQSTVSVVTRDLTPGQALTIPINHFSGSFTCDQATYDELEMNDRIILRYADNPNGSLAATAGVCNAAGNVVGLMPHPERAVSALTGREDGRPLLESFLAAALQRA